MRDAAETDDELVESAMTAVLGAHPEALVAGISDEGFLLPPPPSLPVAGHRAVRGRSALDLVVAADRVVVMEAWDRVRHAGAARAMVHLTAVPDRTVPLHFFDARTRHGHFVLVVVADAREVPVGASGAATTTPRVCRIVKDQGAVILAIDEATTAILGWEPEEVVGRRSLELVHPDDHDRAIESWMEMLGGQRGQRVRLRHRQRDGSWRWVEIANANHLDDPDARCVVAETFDISDEMAAHEALRAREQLLFRLAEALPTGLLQLAPDRSVVYTNDRLHTIVGVGPTTDLADQLASVARDDWPIVAAGIDAVLGGEVPDADAEVGVVVPATGEHRLCRVGVRSLTEADGTVTGAIVTVDDVTESTTLRRELERRATHDDLTGCHNRASVMARLEAELTRPGTLVVAFIDLDGFKGVNDRLGHAAGDELLATVARRLRDVTRDDDVVGRIGGDEFLVVCPGVDDHREAAEIGDRIASALHGPAPLAAGTVRVRASVGVVPARPGDTPDILVARADSAMYASKRQATGRPVVAPDA